MLSKYTFRVTGHFLTEGSISFTSDGKQYLFLTDDRNFLENVIVTTKADMNAIPIFQRTPEADTEYALSRGADSVLPSITRSLRNAEGLLSFYGVREINVRHYTQEWVAETEDEEALLNTNRISMGSADPKSLKSQPIPRIVQMCGFLATEKATEYQIAFSFFRKSCIDTEEGRYIDGFYNAFFVLEHLFGGGKFKAIQLKQRFVSNHDLFSAADESRKNFFLNFEFDNPEEKQQSIDKYSAKTTEETLERLVDTRGFLHHHSKERTDKKWHPEGHAAYKLDTSYCQDVARRICMPIVTSLLFCEDTLDKANYVQNLSAVKIVKSNGVV